MSVEIIRLLSGEEIIGDVVNILEDGIEVEDIVRIFSMPSQEGEAIGFTTWIHYTNQKTISIKNSHIICRVPPIDEIRNEYSARHGSGVVIPPTGTLSSEILVD